MDAALLQQVDAAAARVAESRSVYIRGAGEQQLTREEAEALDRRYPEAYPRKPETQAWVPRCNTPPRHRPAAGPSCCSA